MKTILCVEDDRTILENNRKNLTDNGYNVLTAETINDARECLARHTPDAIILDIMLPDGNGLEYLKELRDGGNTTPVLMLTAWNRSQNIANGLDAGADDYIGKPFTYDVLMARLRKMLSNAERVPKMIRRGALSLNVLSAMAFLDGEDLLLTHKEFALLLLFVQHEDEELSAEYLYEEVWEQPMAGDTKSVRNHVSNIRKKIENSGFTISAEYGGGYRFTDENKL